MSESQGAPMAEKKSNVPTVIVAHVDDEEAPKLEDKPSQKYIPKTLELPDCERRKGSVVSFKEIQLYEFSASEKNNENKNPNAFRSLRFYVMALALVSSFVSTYSKTIINFAIIDMIDPEFVAKQQVDKYPTSQAANITLADGPEIPYFDLDHSCPVSHQDRERLLAENEDDISRARSGHGEKFQWDTVKQGLLKAAYSIGHVPFQLPGSRFAEIHGAQLVLCVACSLMAVCCMLAPYLGQISFYLLFTDLILLGIWGSFTTPALITLFSNWLTPSEKSIMMSFYLVSSRLGLALSSLLCGLLIEFGYSWRNVFYSAGWVSGAFAVLFLLIARSRPHEHPLISQHELSYLASKNNLVRAAVERAAEVKLHQQDIELNTSNGHTNGVKEESNQNPPVSNVTSRTADKTGAPWAAILTNKPVIAFAVTKFCVKLSGDTLQIELPVYLKRVMHFSPKDNGLINFWNYVFFCVGSLVIGALASKMNKSRPSNITKKTTRKIFQSIASFGVALFVLCFAFSVCNNTWTRVFLFTTSVLTTFGIGGEAQMPMDLSERYSGTIHAFASTLSISGVIEPPLVGLLMRGHAADRDSWSTVWIGTSVISFIGGLTFLIFGDAEIQPFENHGREPKCEEVKIDNEDQNGIGKVNEGFEKDKDLEQEGDNKTQKETVEGREAAGIVTRFASLLLRVVWG